MIGERITRAIKAVMAALDVWCAAAPLEPAPAGPDAVFEAALAHFDDASSSRAPSPGVQLYEVYRKARPVLAGVLPFLALLPSAGPRIARAIETLMVPLDQFSPVIE